MSQGLKTLVTHEDLHSQHQHLNIYTYIKSKAYMLVALHAQFCGTERSIFIEFLIWNSCAQIAISL